MRAGSGPAVGGSLGSVHKPIVPAVGGAAAGRSSSSTIVDQLLAAITSRWWQEFLFHVCVTSCWQRLGKDSSSSGSGSGV